MVRSLLPGFLLIAFICLTGCKAFMHGYTWDKSLNSYSLVNGNKNNFGDKRIRDNRGFHKNSSLVNFLDSRGDPSFIFEYRTPDKRRGIELFYKFVDSVYVFEEPAKGNLRSVFLSARKMSGGEQETYQKLTSKK